MKTKNTIILSVGLLLFGCSAVNRQSSENLSNRISAKANTTRSTTTDAETFDKSQEDTHVRAERIANAVNEIGSIEKASVVITGNTAIIGIEVEGELTDTKLIELKKVIETKTRETDESISHVAVTAGAELIKRIDDIADFTSGKDYKPSLTDKQENIVNSLTPTF